MDKMYLCVFIFFFYFDIGNFFPSPVEALLLFFSFVIS